MGLLAFTYADGIAVLVKKWTSTQEYSHGFFIPAVSAWLVWLKRAELAALEVRDSWLGPVVMLFGAVILLLGNLSAIWSIVHYSLVVTIAGLVLSLYGGAGLRILWAPVVYLLFAVPLPQFIYQELSAQLQLISSVIGVELIRLWGISVFLEGNVIDLGVYKLQVAEACNGLRYLFPLTSFGFLCAYIFSAPLWQRLLIFVSTIPITVLMNSVRVGVIGVLVEYFGIEMAEGFLHDFEGWMVFMVCVTLLFGEIWLLNRLRGEQRGFADLLDLPANVAVRGPLRVRAVSASHKASGVLMAIIAVGSWAVAVRAEVVPVSKPLGDLPLQLDDWSGRRVRLDDVIVTALGATDYLLVDYVRPDGELVNAFVAYYASQRSGQASHSPRACIPGGGWQIGELSQVRVGEMGAAGKPLLANRVEIHRGEQRQLVYYWFAQRGRILTNEYLVKWYLFWDALTRNRSDGGLVRLVTPLLRGETWADGDRRLTGFAAIFAARLGPYLPR